MTGVFILKHATKDCTQPKLSKDFFDKNPLDELSAARLLYSNLANPKIEWLVSKAGRLLTKRGKEEAKRIRKETNPEKLLKMMEQGPDAINHRLLKKKVLKYSKFTVPKIIEKLKGNQNDTFVELAVSIIYESKADCSSQLLEILPSIKHPYTLSQVCMLLGLIGKREAIRPIWNYHHFFKERYPKEGYDQGPLLALYELRFRFDKNISVGEQDER